jgi:hypothetical protein
MELANIIRFIAKQQGIESVDFDSEVHLVDEGEGPFIEKWSLPIDKPTEQDLMDAEGLAQAEADSLAVRKKRDILLCESDWVTCKCYDLGIPVYEDWVLYRKSLRDLPQDKNFPNVEFPVKPNDT